MNQERLNEPVCPPASMTSCAATGIPALDYILCGGLPRNRMYLVQGEPGVGKTTLALQFLLAGKAADERGLYITLSETNEELQATARSHGWSLDEIDLFELSAGEQLISAQSQHTIFHPAEVELPETTRALLDVVERVRPSRVVFDSLSELRLMSGDPLRYRRQILSLKHYFGGRKCTVILLDDRTADPEDQLRSVAHGVIVLEQASSGYGGDRRRLRIAKLRGTNFRDGYHDFVIATGGIQVFPRLGSYNKPDNGAAGVIPSGLKPLDELMGGGLIRGTSLLLLGPAGSGKSTVATQYVHAAVERGEHAAMYLFDERASSLRLRARGLGLAIDGHVEAGRVHVQTVNAGELTPGELIDGIRRKVELDGLKVVVIDSLNGVMNAMPQERHLTLQLHELLTFLGASGVTCIMVLAQHGLTSAAEVPVDLSYLADSVLLFRFYEHAGEVRRALSMVKKRTGSHERTIRDFRMSAAGIEVGPALREFRGVLTGTPTYAGKPLAGTE